MEKTQVVLFNKENVKNILEQFDFKFSPEEEGTAIIDSEGNLVKCTCGRLLTVETVGNIAHGSRKLFCDNPLCLATWVAKNKIK